MKKYEIVEGKKTKELAIRLNTKPFKGMIIKFGKVGIQDMGSHANLAFDFAVIKGTLPKQKRNMSLLENTLGDILVEILENTIDAVEFNNGDNREDHSPKPDSE